MKVKIDLENWKNNKWILHYLFSKFGYAPLNFDTDNKKHAKIVAKKLLKTFGKPYEIYYRISSSGRGMHFKVMLNGMDLYLPKDVVLKIRKRLRDDYSRVKIDRFRFESNSPISILFDKKQIAHGEKIKREAGKWKLFDKKEFKKDLEKLKD